MRVRYVRTGVRRSGARVQEWRSETSGRVYEVLEANSFSGTDALEPGTSGHLRFEKAIPVVTRNATDPVVVQAVPQRIQQPEFSRQRARGTEPTRTRRPLTPGTAAGLPGQGARFGKWFEPWSRALPWLLPAVLVLVVIWHLI